jgi:hypothetical protein
MLNPNYLLNQIPNRPGTGGLGQAFKQIASSVAGIVGGAGANLMGISPEYRDLMTLQMEMNEQSQRVNLMSNLEKTKHDMKMAAIRNIRMN